MRFCISLPVSLEGVGSDCWLSCHTTISGEEDQDWSFFWDSLLTSMLVQSDNLMSPSLEAYLRTSPNRHTPPSPHF